VSLWIRVFYLTRFNEHVGKLTSILQKVILDMVLYFIFFLIVIAFFAAVAEVAFRNLLSYNTFYSAY